MTNIRTALITGGSRGLGRALAAALVSRDWRVIIDGRDAQRLVVAGREIGAEPIVGDVADPVHRAALAAAVGTRLDLLVNNASVLGPSPQPGLAEYPLAALEEVYRVNTFAPVALVQALLPALSNTGGRIVNVSSDAAVEAYPGWGGYGSSKAALDHLSAVLAAEHSELRVYAVDPGDMNTDLHQLAFPGEDINDRPSPESVVPALLELIEAELPSGRYRAADMMPVGRR
ncbi:MAG TPA: SDR family NAD(P)-dependent oxidoreductase [Sporichthyaceae bacterium]|jgi:NAD(P)-dependent dehydrogenase (short-subunit alcohol dehydrogenase family)